MARRPTKSRRPPKAADVKAAADRAEARAKGKPIRAAKKPIDPVIVPAAAIVEERGRPTAYKPEYAEMVKQWCIDGATDPEIADLLKVDVRTIYRWKLQHPLFCQAIQAGKDFADDRVERAFYQRAVGYSFEAEKVFCFQGAIVRAKTTEQIHPDPSAAMKWLASRRKDRWAETTRTELTGKDGAAIEIKDTTKLELARWIAFQLAQATPIKTIEG